MGSDESEPAAPVLRNRCGLATLTWGWGPNSFIERPEREVKASSIDIVYQKLLDDLKKYCTEQEIEEECRVYAEKKKRGIPTKTAGESRIKEKSKAVARSSLL